MEGYLSFFRGFLYWVWLSVARSVTAGRALVNSARIPLDGDNVGFGSFGLDASGAWGILHLAV
jgi:hypothetical protein